MCSGSLLRTVSAAPLVPATDPDNSWKPDQQLHSQRQANRPAPPKTTERKDRRRWSHCCGGGEMRRLQMRGEKEAILAAVVDPKIGLVRILRCNDLKM